MRHTKTFTVQGRGHFPYDMLRYDCCFPLTSEDAAILEDHSQRSVTLTRPVDKRTWEPTVARWNSFGWQVVDTYDTSFS